MGATSVGFRRTLASLTAAAFFRSARAPTTISLSACLSTKDRAPGALLAWPGSGRAPDTYVTTKAFLSYFGFDALHDLSEMKSREDKGWLSKEWLLAGDCPIAHFSEDHVEDNGAFSPPAEDEQTWP